jgi:ABC-type Fe3+-siderophore transport system permease subunit
MSCLFALVGLALAVMIVTFLRNVSLWSFLMVSLVFVGMALTFLLGAFVGSDYARKQQLSNQPAGPANTIHLIGTDTPRPQRQMEILISRR